MGIGKLAGRYRYLEPYGPKGAATWLALDEKSTRQVVAAALPLARVAALEGVVGLRHPHISAIVDVVHEPKAAELPEDARSPKLGAVAISEHVDGQFLQSALKSGPLGGERAVRIVTKLAAGVATLHRAGGVHGAISPRNVVLDPAGRDGPVLVHGAATPMGSYCSLDRINGAGPSPADDTWALWATLFAAVVGRPAFAGKAREELVQSMSRGVAEPLAKAKVDAVLSSVLARALVAESSEGRSLGALEASLAAWLAKKESGEMPPSQKPPSGAWHEPASLSALAQDDEDEQTQLFKPADVVDALAALEQLSSPMQHDSDSEGEIKTVMMQSPLSESSSDEERSDLESTGLRVQAGDPLPAFPSAPEPRFPPSPFTAKVSRAPGAGLDAQAAAALAAPLDSVGPNAPLRVLPPIPAPFQLSAQSTPAVPLPMATGASSNRVLVWVAVALAAAVAVALALLVVRSRAASAGPSSPAAPLPLTRPAVPASAPAPAPALSPPAVPLSPQKSVADCVRGHFPEGTFTGQEDFGFLCGNEDLRGINSLLYRRIVVAGTGKVTGGMREWALLGWYELGVTAAVRSDCCPAPVGTVSLPRSPGPCDAMPDVLAVVAARTKSPAATADHFADALRCYYANGVARPYEYKPPTGTNRRAFEAFLERNPKRR